MIRLRDVRLRDIVNSWSTFLLVPQAGTAPAQPTVRQIQRAIAELHRAECRMTGSETSEEPEFYDICVHCTELLNEAVEPGRVPIEVLWPCDTARAARLHELAYDQQRFTPGGEAPF